MSASPRSLSIPGSPRTLVDPATPTLRFEWDGVSQASSAFKFAGAFSGFVSAAPITSLSHYSYEDIGADQVRLVCVHTGLHHDIIHCHLETVNSKDLERRSYRALSYAWGNDNATEDIYVTISHESQLLGQTLSSSSSRTLQIRPNLFKALQSLRSPSEDIWFWVDAICINQQDSFEKTHQLSKMMDIYRNAESVCIWIGETGNPKSNDGEKAMDFVPSIVNLSLLDRMVKGETIDESIAINWVEFANLLRRPWFQRRWVIQEVASAAQASVHCGSKCLNWIDFADAIQLFMENIESIRSAYAKSRLSQWNPDALNHIESVGAAAIVNAAKNVVRKSNTGKILSRPSDIETLVTTFVHFEVSDPRDTVYALLSLASDGHFSLDGSAAETNQSSPSIISDYTKPPLQAYIGFVKHCVETHGSLDIICRHWALPLPNVPQARKRKFTPLGSPEIQGNISQSRLPTWIGLASESAFGPPSRFTGRINGDSLVGTPGHRIYSATQGTKAKVRFGTVPVEKSTSASTEQQNDDPDSDPEDTNQTNKPSQTNTTLLSENGELEVLQTEGEFDGTLWATGFILGEISRISSRVVDGTIPDDFLALAGWMNEEDVNNIPDRLWRILVADRASDGKKIPSCYRRTCMYALSKASGEGDLNTSRLIANRSHPYTVIDYLKRVQAIVWSRRLFYCRPGASDAEPLYGLGSRYIKENDLVCLLYGCSVPVIIRERELHP